MHSDEGYMMRCIELAAMGGAKTAPNPMVGALLVHHDRIIGEGYHETFGGPHAEVQCIASVKPADRSLIKEATLYVSLEPCAHHGKTPPCTNLIIENKIPKVVVAMQDPFGAVNGNGIRQLKEAGLEVRTGIAQTEAQWLNRRFITYHTKKRPYVILKWAQTSNGKMAGPENKRIQISNPYTTRLVHRWRSEESAILVGKKTALNDDPLLTTRYWTGPSPKRIVIDNKLTLPSRLNIFMGEPTLVLNHLKDGQEHNQTYIKYPASGNSLQAILDKLYAHGIMSVMVEGGPSLLSSFLQAQCWDEIRTITNNALIVDSPCQAPTLPDQLPIKTIELGTDTIRWFRRYSHLSDQR